MNQCNVVSMYVCIFSDFQISPGLKSSAANLFGVEFVHSMLHAFDVVFPPYRMSGIWECPYLRGWDV